MQSHKGVQPVHLLGAMLLRLDHQYTSAGDAAVMQGQQPLLDSIGQGRGRNVKAQVNGAGDLVDVLPPCPLGAHRGDLHLGLANLQVVHRQ